MVKFELLRIPLINNVNKYLKSQQQLTYTKVGSKAFYTFTCIFVLWVQKSFQNWKLIPSNMIVWQNTAEIESTK